MMEQTAVNEGETGSAPAAAPSGSAVPTAAGFADLDEEVALDSIPVEGAPPGGLRGELIRVTPAKFDIAADNRIRHWFDGLAMLHRFAIQEGKVSYANRFLETEAHANV